MDNLFRKPKKPLPSEISSKYKKFHLLENPFPSNPILNTEASDKRINGNIFEPAIRNKEDKQITEEFLKHSQADPNHRRLGYIMDTSYVGRGNGKSAFIVNLQEKINSNYCLDISEETNKCFAIRVVPEAGGRTKTFASFVDIIISAIFKSKHIEHALAVLRFDALSELHPDKISSFSEQSDLVEKLNDIEWCTANDIDIFEMNETILKNQYVQKLSQDFPLSEMKSTDWFNPNFTTLNNFKSYYVSLKKVKDKLDFLFTDLVLFFEAAGFNGAYIFVDDFEKIADFQSAQLKKDFAREFRACLFDGPYINSSLGFFNFILVVHAGLPRLLDEAWRESGMEARVPMTPSTNSQHIIRFEKLSTPHSLLLIKKYLNEFRDSEVSDELFPFTLEAVKKIVENSEYNATEILRRAYNLLVFAVEDDNCIEIDLDFVNKFEEATFELDGDIPRATEHSPINLLEKK